MRYRVLLVEDDRIVRNNTAEILRFADYDVLTASNGKEGVLVAKEEMPDIIICDIMMPKLDGYAVFQILSNDHILKKIPFIFLTAKTNYKDIRKGMNIGADDFLTKPFHESELLSTVKARLKKVEIYKSINITKSDSLSVSQLNGHDAINSFIKVFVKRKEYLYKKGENVFCEGNNSNHIFLIKKGRVKTYKTTKEGKDLITALFSKNKFFGITSTLGKFPHTENAEALEDTKVIKINKKEVFSIVKKNPSIAHELIHLLASNIKNSREKMVQIAYDSVRGRTAKSILVLSENAPLNRISITRSDLANLTGIAKETLIRTLSDFKEEGLIETGRTFVRVINKEDLMEIS